MSLKERVNKWMDLEDQIREEDRKNGLDPFRFLSDTERDEIKRKEKEIQDRTQDFISRSKTGSGPEKPKKTTRKKILNTLTLF